MNRFRSGREPLTRTPEPAATVLPLNLNGARRVQVFVDMADPIDSFTYERHGEFKNEQLTPATDVVIDTLAGVLKHLADLERREP